MNRTFVPSCVSPLLLGLACLVAAGCTTKPPTVAHVHIGHAITGVHVTPNQDGYFVVAVRQAKSVYDLATQANDAFELAVVKQDIAAAVHDNDSDPDFGVKHSIVMSANHITFAATSDDASTNVQQAAPIFASHVTRVVERCDLITLLGADVANAQTVDEARVSVLQIRQLALANISGEGSSAGGQDSSVPAEWGLVQLRHELDAMIARESPPYRTVDQWYLFNLVRLPNGRWVFDRLGRGGNIEGYK
jgi:hypothetical protein